MEVRSVLIRLTPTACKYSHLEAYFAAIPCGAVVHKAVIRGVIPLLAWKVHAVLELGANRIRIKESDRSVSRSLPLGGLIWQSAMRSVNPYMGTNVRDVTHRFRKRESLRRKTFRWSKFRKRAYTPDLA